MQAHAANAERMVMTTRRYFLGHARSRDGLEYLHRAAGQIEAANKKIKGGNAWIWT